MKKNPFLVLMIMLGFCSCKKDTDRVSDPQVDVYVAGTEYNGSVMVAEYWKNGQVVTLTDGTNNAYAYSIAVVGSDVYVGGAEFNGSFWEIKYWKNGKSVLLMDSTSSPSPYSIAVIGNDVYVVGYQFNGLGVAQYLKNGKIVS